VRETRFDAERAAWRRDAVDAMAANESLTRELSQAQRRLEANRVHCE
jgi:hypothetical protein